jgi:hypothetical protein
MAVGDFWDVSAAPSNGNQPNPNLVTSAGIDPVTALDQPVEEVDAEVAAGERKARLTLAKVLPVEAKHRGGGRRSSAAKQAGVAIAELDDVDEALRRRNEILVAAIKRTQDLYIVTDQRQIFRLAATDLFVERAQFVLAQRARSMWRAGIVSTASAVALLIGLSAFLVWRAEAISSASLSGTNLTLGLVEMLASAAIVFFAVRYLIKLSRSFFRENVALVAKQHALGFGRLYVYTNPDTARLKDMQDAFGLDLESTPIFLDMRSRETADTLYAKVTQDLGLSLGN